jgi:radical SAM/Cys-rich protein
VNGFDIKPSFAERVLDQLMADGVNILQVNTGYVCNIKCRHCHVGAGPERTESMSRQIMKRCLDVLDDHAIGCVDITGGSPELHPHLRWFIEGCAAAQRRLIVRTNGLLLVDCAYGNLLDFYASHGVEIVLSLPSVDARTTDRQRGDGVFAKAIEAIRKLNERGYGRIESGLVLDLVHNPTGAYLPASQASLEPLYRETLMRKYGVSFNRLYCITNMPVGRYLDYLKDSDNYDDYMKALIKSFNKASLSALMCRSTVSVGWDGRLYDCDFNQMLGLPIDHGAPDRIEDFELDRLKSRQIVVGNHCYGCTAGAGSSCQGQIAKG